MILDQRVVIPEHPLSIYPFREMQVGESFLVEGRICFERAKQAAYVFAHRYPEYKFSCRKVTQTSGRIWRIK